MDYSQLSDFEINNLILNKVSNGKPEEWLEPYALFDPCNNPADAWPIILNNGINVFTDMTPHGLLGQARASVISPEPPNSECIIAKDANPLRAAMIVFLMMQDAKHA